MKVNCPNCSHSFDDKSLLDLGGTLQIKKYDEFRALLTAPAKKIYDTPITGTVFQAVRCAVCKTDELVTLEETVKLANRTGLPQNEIIAEVWPHHVGHDLTLHAKVSHMMVGVVESSLQSAIVSPYGVDRVLEHLVERRLRVMAHVFNLGVAEDWISYGVLSGAFGMDMAMLSPVYRRIIGCIPGINVPGSVEEQRQWLNTRLGAELFTSDGAEAHSEPWDAYAKANNIA